MNNNKVLRNAGQTGTLSFLFFLITLCFAPLAFGTTETWSLWTVETLTALTGVFLFCTHSFSQKNIYLIPGIKPLLLLTFLMMAQCIPLPSPLVRLISPNIFEIYAQLFKLQGSSSWLPLTVHYKATLVESLRISSYFLFYILTVQLLSESTRLKITVRILIILSAGIAFLALMQKFISPHKIYGFKEIPASAWQGALGPWINPNQYAGFMVMVCPLLLVLFFNVRRPATDKNHISFKERIIEFFSSSQVNKRLFLAFFLTLMLASIFLSHSRGGVISILFTLILSLFILRHLKGHRIHPLPVIFICFLLGIAAYFNWHPITQKFLSTISSQDGTLSDGRIKVWQDCIQMVHDYPVFGSGFGTFQDLYPSYKSFTDIYLYNHAHNDYIELLTDGGLVAFLLTAWFVTSIIISGWKQLQLRRDTYSLFVTTASLAGIAGILVYSVTDFNLHNGANGLYFFFLCGLVVSAGHTRHHFKNTPTLLPIIQRKTKNSRLFCLASACLLVAVTLVMGGSFLAEKKYTHAVRISNAMMRPEKKRAMMMLLLQDARRYDPWYSKYDYALANLEQQAPDKSKALGFCISAIRKQPTETSFYTMAERLKKTTSARMDE